MWNWYSSLFIPVQLVQVFLPWRELWRSTSICDLSVLLKPRGGARLQRKEHKPKPNKLQNFHIQDVIMERDSQQTFSYCNLQTRVPFGYVELFFCTSSANISILTLLINKQTCAGLENSSACSGGRAHLSCTDEQLTSIHSFRTV